MTNKKSVFLGGVLVGALILSGTPASADAKKHEEQHRWENRHDEKWQEHTIGEIIIALSVMSIMPIVATIINRRFEKISPISAEGEKRSSKTARNCARITKS